MEMFPLRHNPRNFVLAASAFLIVLVTEQVTVCHASGHTATHDVTTECSSARARLGLAATASGQPHSRTSICQASGKCCPLEDETKLLSRAKHFVKTSIKQQFSSLVNVTRHLSRSLDAAVCHQLAAGYRRAHQQLVALYRHTFERNSAVLNEFYQWLHAAYEDCNQCEQSVEGPVREFFTTIQVFIIRERQSILALSPGFVACARRHADFSWHEDLNHTFWNTVTSVRRAVCNTCLLKKALNAAGHLARDVQRREPRPSCVRRVACMQSCACCSGNATACERRPCQSCCHAALAPCVDHLEDTQEMLRDLVVKLEGKMSFMQGSNAPDHHFASFGGRLVDWAEHTSRTERDLRTKIEQSCGHFHLGTLSVRRPQRPSPALVCKVRSFSSSSVRSVLKTLKARLSKAMQPALHIKHGVCGGHSKDSTPCNECPTCHAPARSPVAVQQELHSALARQSMALLAFQSSIPELYEVGYEAPSVEASASGHGGECDDEDAECDDASGGSGGSGNEETVTSQVVRQIASTAPPQSESHESQLTSTEERATKPYESGAPHTAANSGILMMLPLASLLLLNS